jgi:hypothetical protein
VTALAEPGPAAVDQAEILKPYVPRLLLRWIRESPESRYQAVDGSLAFVHISGFTALTERLAYLPIPVVSPAIK